MAGSDSEDRSSDDRSRDERDSNPFVAFRRFADDQFSSVFSRLSEPFQGDWSKREQALRDAHSEAWKRFESSYERATNPERRQTERRSEDDPVHAAPPPRYRSLEVRTNEQRERQNQGGHASRPWWATSSGEAAPQEEDQSESRHCGRRPRVRTINITPFGVESSDSNEAEQQREGSGQYGPFSWSWSWGPSNAKSTSQPEPSQQQNTDSETRTHTFGPWSFGPIHVGSMTTSATFPRQVEQDLRGLFSEIETLGKHFEQAEQRLLPEEPSDSSYSPLALSKDTNMSQRLNWCLAFEDLMAANKGDQLPSYNEHHSALQTTQQHPSWVTQMMRRGMIDDQIPWHRDLFALHQNAPPYDSRPDDQNPETELDFYERQELANQRQAPQHPRVDIISRISTVERVTLPDGSVSTKRTMKKRFTDGTEETEDSTEQSPAMRPARAVEAAEPSESTERSTTKKSEKSGWFW